MTHNYLALDLGASGGRAIIGRFDGERLALEEVHRFANGPTQLPNAYGSSLYWDALGFLAHVKEGLIKAVACCGSDPSTGSGGLVSVGLDTWGVDFGLLDRDGVLLGNPYHYRDSRTDGMLEEAFRRVPRDEIFAATGIQFMQLNTLYQLLAMVVRDDPILRIADTLLFTPDLLNYWLTGRKVSERSIASTSQCLDPFTGDWAKTLLERLGIPTAIFPSIIPPGTALGELLPHVAEETGARGITVVAPGCHDTASAVAAVPAESENYAYLSSGTWSLMGVETRQPIVDDKSLAFNVTNEGGVCDTIRLLKNITGLWVIQECRRTWMQEGTKLSWEEIVGLAAAAPAFTALIDVDAHEFIAPGDMPARIRAYCAATGQPVPQDRGTVARVVLESLALKYRRTLEMLDELTGRSISVLHIVGGGTQNRLLSQFAANAIGRPVVAGPIEATAAGNILMQMLAMGDIASLAEGRAVIRRSFDTEPFEPRDVAQWDEAYGRICRLVA
jgi:rhamnulokinase